MAPRAKLAPREPSRRSGSVNPAFIAGAWLGLGLLASAVLRRQTARLVAIVPLAGAGLTLLTARSPAAAIPLGGLSGIAGLDRTGEGVLVAAALSMALVLLLQPSVDVSVGRTIGVVGASATIAMASSDPLLTALALTAAVATLVPPLDRAVAGEGDARCREG